MTDTRSHTLKTDADVLRELTRLIFRAGATAIDMGQRWSEFETAFCNFDPTAVAKFGPDDVAKARKSKLSGNRIKLAAVAPNARTLLRLSEVYGSFSAILDALAAERYERRVAFLESTFSQVGPVTAAAFLQLAGLGEEPHG